MSNIKVRAKSKFMRLSVCATCLSHDRAMYPVTVEMLRFGFSVHKDDRVCWECRHFVSKISVFNNRALRAQALLKDWLTGKGSKVDCLSSLGKSTGLSLDIPNSPAIGETTFRIELLKQEAVTDDEANCDEVPDDETKNEEVPDDEAKSEEATPKKRGRNRKVYVKIPKQFYTEKKMSEDEMLAWRERKKSLKDYTTSIPIYRCEKCIVGFISQIEFDDHMKRHSEEYGSIHCHICEQRCHDEVAISQHKETHYKLFTCDLCGHEWDDANAMREHGEAAHKLPPSSWQCELCLEEYPLRSALNKHYKSHLRAPCAECGARVGGGAHGRMRHSTGCSQRCVETKKIRCEVCGKECKSRAHALLHRTRTHADEADPEAYCVPCAVQFRTVSTYKMHLKNSSKHLSEQGQRYECDACNKTFCTKVRLGGHIKHQHGNAVTCDACGKVVKNALILRKHVRRVHRGEAPARDKVCEHCGKTFTSTTSLRAHINSHTGARPYKCALCDATFGYKSALYLHGRYKHKINKKKDKNDEESALTDKKTYLSNQ